MTKQKPLEPTEGLLVRTLQFVSNQQEHSSNSSIIQVAKQLLIPTPPKSPTRVVNSTWLNQREPNDSNDSRAVEPSEIESQANSPSRSTGYFEYLDEKMHNIKANPQDFLPTHQPEPGIDVVEGPILDVIEVNTDYTRMTKSIIEVGNVQHTSQQPVYIKIANHPEDLESIDSATYMITTLDCSKWLNIFENQLDDFQFLDCVSHVKGKMVGKYLQLEDVKKENHESNHVLKQHAELSLIFKNKNLENSNYNLQRSPDVYFGTEKKSQDFEMIFTKLLYPTLPTFKKPDEAIEANRLFFRADNENPLEVKDVSEINSVDMRKIINEEVPANEQKPIFFKSIEEDLPGNYDDLIIADNTEEYYKEQEDILHHIDLQVENAHFINEQQRKKL